MGTFFTCLQLPCKPLPSTTLWGFDNPRSVQCLLSQRRFALSTSLFFSRPLYAFVSLVKNLVWLKGGCYFLLFSAILGIWIFLVRLKEVLFCATFLLLSAILGSSATPRMYTMHSPTTPFLSLHERFLLTITPSPPPFQQPTPQHTLHRGCFLPPDSPLSLAPF